MPNGDISQIQKANVNMARTFSCFNSKLGKASPFRARYMLHPETAVGYACRNYSGFVKEVGFNLYIYRST